MAKDEIKLFYDDDPEYYESDEYDTGVIVNGHTFYTHCKIDGLIYLVELDEYTETPQQGERVITH